MRRFGWTAITALGFGLALAALAAGVAGTLEAMRQGWWEAGFTRLAAAATAARFDRWGIVAAATMLAIAGARLLAGRPRPRPGLAWTALTLGALALGLRAAVAIDAWEVRDGPNLVLISIDTLRADRLGAYGYAKPTSPGLDRRLAATGVTFEEVWSQSPKTTPSHMTMLTSLYPSVHGITLWQKRDDPAPALNPAVHTLAEVLKNAGYATCAVTGGANIHRDRGFGQGFDRYRHHHQLERAREWLAAHRHRKLFLFFHTFAVHDPYTPPARWVEALAPPYEGPVRDAVATLRRGIAGWWRGHRIFWESVDPSDPATVAFVSGLYDAGIRHMDETTLGPLLDELDRLGLTENTLVVFTSDHGEAFGEHGRFLHDDLHAETLHVPLILRFPGRLPAGARVAARAELVDLMPTVLDLLGVPVPPSAQGRSLVPRVAAASAPPAESPPAFSDYSDVESGRRFESVRDDRYAFIVDGGTEQLFDRAVDPMEQRSVAAARPTIVASFRDALERWHARCRPLATRLHPGTAGAGPDAETARQLEALGYLESK